MGLEKRHMAPVVRFAGRALLVLGAVLAAGYEFIGLAVFVFLHTRAEVFANITGCGKAVAKKWAWRANLLTYAIGMAATLGWLLVSISRHVPAANG